MRGRITAGGQNEHHAVRAIYQNTIDYDEPPGMDLPNRTVLQDFGWHHAIDLWVATAILG
ncbi:MAG: hypothetical protein PHD58_00805 [Anaerolineales bacterium]|nr:hypothetical protein [Anaerolineales bacterium]